ncbi:MAG: trehalose-6-phosphate synthase [Gemmatimonadaceae bacterium]
MTLSVRSPRAFRLTRSTWPKLLLAAVRRNRAVSECDARLLIASNRLPVTVANDGPGFSLQQSVGGLATGLRHVHERSSGKWFGWPGSTSQLDELARRELGRELEAQRVVALELGAAREIDLYTRLSNGTLWPVLHDRLDVAASDHRGWSAYESVNARFADALAREYRAGDLVWVHDYHLLRVPALLRERIPDARIGFFFHTPFPNEDLFSALPARRDLLVGVLGADLIGFHTVGYRRNFARTVDRLLGVTGCDDGNQLRLTLGERSVRLGVYPMGIDTAAFEAQALQSSQSILQTLEFRTNGIRTLLGVDRLDYSKGLTQRLLGFERLLARHPRWHTRVRLVQVAVPSRLREAAYRRHRREIEHLVGRINGAYATPNWTPVVYMHRCVPIESLVALYRVSDVMLVTSLRDGMNLVAKEFVASRIDGDGVLVLSEFAGAASQLTDAIHINPYDVREIAAAINDALIMPRIERRIRMRRLRAQVHAQDVHWWANNFMSALGDATRPEAGDSIAPAEPNEYDHMNGANA